MYKTSLLYHINGHSVATYTLNRVFVYVLDDNVEVYNEELASGGLNNRPAPSEGDDLGDYVPHEPQVKSEVYSSNVGQLANVQYLHNVYSER